jgi:hypothetical protein
MRATRLALLLALLSLVVAPTTASAVEQTGRGAGIAHVKNIAYPDLHASDERNHGTDLEFATITLPGSEAAAPAAPGSGPKAKPRKLTGCARFRTFRVRTKCRRAAARARARCKRFSSKRRRATCLRAVTRRYGPAPKARKRFDARLDMPGIQRTFAFAGSYGDGLAVIDVTDPENATRVATWDCGISQGDVQVFRRADLGGRWFVTFTHDDGYDFHADSQCAKDLEAMGFNPKEFEGAGTYIADVTNPYAPKTVSFVPVEAGSHNQSVHPSGRYLYNSNSDLITSVLPAIEIIDIGDLAHPRKVGEIALKTFPGLGTESHDIGFSADGRRAYVAALSHGEILDTTDPAKPESIGTIVDPAINVWHETEAITIDDPILGKRDFLIAEDEVAGALGTGQCPNGGVHVYDITGDLEQTPVKVGAWNIDDVGPTESTLGTCTAHVFQLHRREQLMTIAYYNGGVRVVDLSGLVGVALGENGVGMKQLGWYRFPDSDTWAVKAPFVSRSGFYLYGNDHARGFDVYRWRPSAAGAASAGRWLSPEEAAAASQRLRVAGAGARLTAICLLNPGKGAEVREAATRANLDL